MITTNKYVFVHLQKCGGSFIEKYLQENYDCQSHFPKHRGVSTIPPGHLQKTPFGAVRNPYSWYTSWFHANMEADSTLFPEIFRDGMTFEDFIFEVANPKFDIQHDINGEVLREYGIGPYTYRYLRCFCFGSIEYAVKYTQHAFGVRHILHQENLNEELADFLNLAGDKRLELLDRGKYNTSNHESWEELFTDDMKDIIRKTDSIIFERHYNG